MAGGPGGPSGRKKKGGPWRIVFWIALVVLVCSLVALGVIGFGYWQGQQKNAEVSTEAFTPPEDIAGANLADLTVDWDALRAINPETVGWIYIPDTVVNYPIVHTADDNKYLKTDFKGETNWVVSFGAIFLSAENAANFSDANNIVYGHNMNDGSMFSHVASLDDTAQFNKHRTVYILTPQGNYRLNSFSLVHVPANDPLVQTTFASDDERTAYVQDKMDRSVVAPDPAAPAAADITKMFALATCDNLPSDGRYVLFCSVVESTVAQAGDSTTGETVDPGMEAAIGEAAEGL